MRKRINVLIIGLVVCFSALNASAVFEVSASFQISARADFYAPLGGVGTWIEVGNYGRCWHPSGVAVEWQPYCHGQWVWTECGWYWESDEPWAWACYHYGRWMHDPASGWVWIPDVEWAPAWVTWRVGGGYCGWAPLAPAGFVMAPGFFAFVEARHFSDPIRRSTVIVNNTTIINQTTQITNVKQETRHVGGTTQRVMVNEGPGLATIQKASDKHIREVPIREVAGKSVPQRDMIKPMREPAGAEKQSLAPSEPTGSERPEKKTAPPERSAPPTRDVAPPSRDVTPPSHEVAPRPSRPPVETAPAPHGPSVRPGSARPPEERGRERDDEKSHGHGRDKP